MSAMPARQIEFSEEDVLRAEAKAELDCRRCFGYEEDGKHVEGDGVYFVENYVHIEDRSSGKPQWVLFRLWPCQVRVWAKLLVERFILILKARQLGLTWLLVSFALWRMMAVPGFRVLGLSKKYDFAKVNLLERLVNMLKRLPRWMIRQRIKAEDWKSFAGHTWERVGDEIRIYHPLKEGATVQEISIFTIMATTSDGARSFTADLIILDEYAYAENPEEMWSAMVPVIDQPGSTQQGVLLSTNQAGTHFDELVGEASEGRGTFAKGFIFLEWFQHPLRDMVWYESAKEKDPLYYRREYPATIEDSRSVASGTFFQKFSREIHAIDPFDIPRWWRRWLANDPGYTDPFAWYWMAVSEDGIVYVYREYAPRQSKQDERIIYSDQAREVAKLSRLPESEEGKPAYERFEFLVTGHDAYAADPETGKCIADYYAEAFRKEGLSVGIVPTEADRERRAAIMTEYIEPYQDGNSGKTRAKLRIFGDCTYLLKSLPAMVCDEKHPEKYADHPADHPVDALGYGLQQWHPEKAKAPADPKAPIASFKDDLARKAQRLRRQRRSA